MAKQTKKERLFNSYHNNAIASGQSELKPDLLFCPLCLKAFPIAGLTIEHILPSSVGGNNSAVVLTCKRCNNTHGSALDANLSGFQKHIDSSKGHGTASAVMDTQGRKVTVDVSKSKSGRITLFVCPKRSNPRNVSAMQDSPMSPTDTFKLDFKSNFSDSGFAAALVRCAYLAMFRKFGFQYLAIPEVELIRRQINEPTKQFVDLDTIIGKGSDAMSNLVRPYALGKSSGEHHYFICLIELKTKTSSYRNVLMPPRCSCHDKFFEFAGQLKKGGKTTLDINVFPSLDFKNDAG